jgi:uncharacterized protein (TIRG00374 family)
MSENSLLAKHLESSDISEMKRLISIAISLLILAVIYWRIDLSKLVEALGNSHAGWMVIAIGMVIPLTLLTAWRLQQLVPSGKKLAFGEANRLILAASGMNMVLPSKMGDIAKAYFMQKQGYLNGSLALSMVIFEKSCDMLSLLVWCVFGLILYTEKDGLFWVLTGSVALGLSLGFLLLGSDQFAKLFFAAGQRFAPQKLRRKLEKLQNSWLEMHAYFWQDKARLVRVSLTSLFIWFLHLLQIWFFVLALKAWVPLVINLALAPLAILVGLLPLTFAGVGTRDAAIIFFYQPFLAAPTAAALGLLFTLRYLLPAIGGLPFLRHYLELKPLGNY